VDETDNEEDSKEPEKFMGDIRKRFPATTRSGLGRDYFRRRKSCAGNDGLDQQI